MKERALRYGASAGSEELELIPNQEESEDDEYSLTSSNRTSKRSQGRKRNKSQVETISSTTNQPPINKNSKHTRLSKSMLDLIFSFGD